MAKRNLYLGGNVPMEPGERDRAVEVQQVTLTKDDAEFPVEGWTTVIDVYAVRKEDISGHERFRAGQESAAAMIRWEGGWTPTLDPDTVDVPKKFRFVTRGPDGVILRIYDIEEVQEIGRREGLEFHTLVKVG